MKKNKKQLHEALAVLLTKLSSARDNPLLMDNYAVIRHKRPFGLVAADGMHLLAVVHLVYALKSEHVLLGVEIVEVVPPCRCTSQSDKAAGRAL